MELTDVPKIDFDPITPTEHINRELKQFDNNFKFGHVNARSLNKNILELKAVIDKTSFDAFSISESWLTRNTPKDRFIIEGFNIVRKDRKNKRGGGVCIYIKEQYTYKKILVPDTPDMPEMLWVEISLKHSKLAIGTLYKPPKIPCNTFNQVFNGLAYIYSKYEHTILCGDFNVNMLTPTSYEARTLTDNVIDPFSLAQLIKTPTRITDKSSTLLDLLLVNNANNVLVSGACDAPGISDHFITYLVYSLKKEKFKPEKIQKRDFRNLNLENFENAIEAANWENVYTVESLDDKVTILENTINDILDIYAPYHTFVIRKADATPWITEEIMAKMNERDKLKITFNATGNKKYFSAYKVLKNKVTSMQRQSLKRVFNETINSKIKKPKDFYKAVNKLRVVAEKATSGNFNFSADKLNSNFAINNNTTFDEQLIDEQIQNLYNRNFPCIHKFSFSPVKESDVIKTVKSLKSNSTGADNINAFILKLFIRRISDVLTHIINTSIELNTFPSRWKKAIITPIPKVGIPLSPNDFRPISILATLSKVCEKLINSQIVEYIDKYHLFDPYQSAYRKYSSTATALLKITEDIMESIDDADVTLLILLDFSKAFDTVNHRLLIEKLRIMGFDNNACKWVHSYLTERYQRVRIKNDLSDWAAIGSGVPQGSILGPLLFSILVSDMRNCIWNGSYHMYADDTQLYISTSPNRINDTIEIANVNLDNISKYCAKNALKLNEKKCMWMLIGSRPAIRKIENVEFSPIIINNTVVKRVKYAKNLGVTFDEVLSWRKHVNLCISKAMGLFLQLARYKRFLTCDSKKILCESFVLSQFNYCDAVYINLDISLQYKIQRIQNLCLRYIFDIKKRHHCNYDALRLKIQWLDMKNRRIFHSLTLMFKILNGLAPEYLRDTVTMVSELHERNTRANTNKNIWICKNVKSKIRRSSFAFYAAKSFNEIPENIKNSKSVQTFKNKLMKFLLSNA